jgi:hypothetical protein
MSDMTETPEEKQPEVESMGTDGGSGHLLQTIIASVSIGVAILYAVGMLVTNEYLFAFGLTDFNLIRPKCIITGTWAILLLLACSGPALSLDRFKNGKITAKRLWTELWVGYCTRMLSDCCSRRSLLHIGAVGSLLGSFFSLCLWHLHRFYIF